MSGACVRASRARLLGADRGRVRRPCFAVVHHMAHVSEVGGELLQGTATSGSRVESCRCRQDRRGLSRSVRPSNREYDGHSPVERCGRTAHFDAERGEGRDVGANLPGRLRVNREAGHGKLRRPCDHERVPLNHLEQSPSAASAGDEPVAHPLTLAGSVASPGNVERSPTNACAAGTSKGRCRASE